MGYSSEPTTTTKENLSLHPNFKLPKPKKDESQISFALRCAGALVSPKQLPGEDNELDCKQVRSEIENLTEKVQAVWDNLGAKADENIN